MDGRRIELSTSILVDVDNWDKTRQEIAGSSHEVRILNNRLLKFVSGIYDIYNQLEAGRDDFDIYTIKEKITGTSSKDYFIELFESVIDSIEKKLGKGYSKGTLKHYKTSLMRLKDFVKEFYFRKDIEIKKVDYTFLSAFDIYLKSKHNIGTNTVWGYHRHVKKVLNDAVSMGLIVRNPYENFKVKRGDANRDFLTLKEIKKIEKKRIQIDRLSIVRDVFVFACYTGLSYSDIAKLSYHHIHKGDDGEDWIIIDRNKTKNRCRIPLLPNALKILRKYKDYAWNESQGLLLPVRSNQKMNAYLKELASICGIKKNLSMHVARHSFATSVTLSNGIPIETVSKMLGHNSLKTTQVYARIVDKKISDDMKKLKAIL
nr:site-specific integrase [uncultured Draconibacterium sp.]